MVRVPLRVVTAIWFMATMLGSGTGFFGLAGTAQAADVVLPPIPTFADDPDKQVEWGSGWYLRGDLGFARDSQPPINADMSYNSSAPSKASWSGSIGFGNKINTWLREDTTLELTNGMNSNGYTNSTKTCQTGATLNGDGITYSPVYSQCYGQEHASLTRGNLMQNAYVDLGTWFNITPSSGVGAGLSHFTTAGNIAYYVSGTNQAYNPTWTDGSGSHTVNWNTTYTPKSTTQLAWSLMGGFSINASDHMKIDVGARFLNSGRLTYVDSNNATLKKELISRQLKVGIRYMID